MMRMQLAVLLGLALAVACKDPETAAKDAKLSNSAAKVQEGKSAMAQGDFAKAAAAFKQATIETPEDPAAYLLLSEALYGQGNDGASVLALKQAEELSKEGRAAIKRQRVELYRRMGQSSAAAATLLELRDEGKLSEPDLLLLARLQAREGQVDAAWKTLERVQKNKPNDPNAKVVEAEILLVSGEELLAAKLMDRLLEENPANAAARLLRARYFLNSGYPDMAEQDLATVTGSAAKEPELVAIRASALNQLKRYEEAVKLLQPLLDADPRNAELLAQLAETKLNLAATTEAQALIDRALTAKPKLPRALYVRARILESQGELRVAVENYQLALRVDPAFGPALSRIWRIHDHRGEKGEAMASLERLIYLNEATLEEKVALAEIYADTGNQLERAKKLVAEALRHEPDAPRLKELAARLGKSRPAPKKTSITILKGK